MLAQRKELIPFLARNFFIATIVLVILCGAGLCAGKNAVIENKIILPKQEENFSQARYLKLRGTNEEIGRTLANIARKELGVSLSKYSSPLFGKARKLYMQKNYPFLFERMKGAASAYGIEFENNIYDFSGLPFNVSPYECSTVYFPPSFTSNGHGLLARNEDFNTRTMREMIGLEPKKGEKPTFSQCFIIETHPDKGYPSLIFTTFDLLSGVLDGINSEGLTVARLTDKSWPVNNHKYYGENSAGLSYFQVARLVLDTCSTVEGAKLTLINNKIYFPVFGGHYLICDRFGNSFVYEESPLDLSPRITDNNGKIQIMTNHPVYEGADLDKFKATMDDPYNTIRRYQTISDALKNHNGKYSPDFIWNVMELVEAKSGQKFWDGKGAKAYPMRTVWTLLYDIDERSVEVKFYLHDKPGMEEDKAEPIYSKPYKFFLN